MKIWYKAVCDMHKEFIDMFVSNPSCTETYLAKYDVHIQNWLEIHRYCSLNHGLRLIADDGPQIDFLYDNNYKKVKLLQDKEKLIEMYGE